MFPKDKRRSSSLRKTNILVLQNKMRGLTSLVGFHVRLFRKGEKRNNTNRRGGNLPFDIQPETAAHIRAGMNQCVWACACQFKCESPWATPPQSHQSQPVSGRNRSQSGKKSKTTIQLIPARAAGGDTAPHQHVASHTAAVFTPVGAGRGLQTTTTRP